jgi:hypothetical protein
MPDAPRLFAVNVVDHPDRGSQVGIIAKRTYDVRDGHCHVAAEQVALVEEPQLSPDGTVLLHDVDIGLNRTQVDVIVRGSAHAAQPRRSFDIAVRVGPFERRLRVFGNRRCFRSSTGNLQFSDPIPTDLVSLGWESAYGGTDMAALARYGDPYQEACRMTGETYEPSLGAFAYPRNRSGKGYVIEASDAALEACALPNLEDAGFLLTPETLIVGRADVWPGAGRVAALGFQAYTTFPRSAMVGLLTPFDTARFAPQDFFEVREGGLPTQCVSEHIPLIRRIHLGVAQQSAHGMRLPEISPGDRVALAQMHPQVPSWVFDLSREFPEMALRMPDSADPTPLSAKIRTLLVEPERDRVCVTWVGEHREPTPMGPGKIDAIRCSVAWRA